MSSIPTIESVARLPRQYVCSLVSNSSHSSLSLTPRMNEINSNHLQLKQQVNDNRRNNPRPLSQSMSQSGNVYQYLSNRYQSNDQYYPHQHSTHQHRPNHSSSTRHHSSNPTQNSHSYQPNAHQYQSNHPLPTDIIRTNALHSRINTIQVNTLSTNTPRTNSSQVNTRPINTPQINTLPVNALINGLRSIILLTIINVSLLPILRK